MVRKLKNFLKKSNWFYNVFIRFVYKKAVIKQKILGDKKISEKKWYKDMGYKLNLDNPITLNEKMMWIKLYDHNKNIYTVLADKYSSRKYIEKNFGKKYLVPLLFVTDKIEEINEKNITNFPCIIKPNHCSGFYHIFRENSINWKKLRRDCKTWLKINYYYFSQQLSYKKMKPYIIVEKLLLTKNGKIPNDYKLFFFNGKFAFIYCSIDREGLNYRQIYDINWKLMPFIWSGDKENNKFIKEKIQKPSTFNEMLTIGKKIATVSKCVRVDFYDVDGKLYCGETTFFHGGCTDKFNPSKYDKICGNLLKL